MAGAVPSAERARRFRARQQQGVSVVAVEVTQDVVAALVERGWLSEAQANDRDAVGAALADLADCWLRGTLTCDAIS